MGTKVISIPQETTDYLQRLSIETDAYESVATRIIEKDKDDPGVVQGDAFVGFMCRLCDVKAEYELAKTSMVSAHLPAWVQEMNCSWNLDFASSAVTVTYTGEINCAG